MILGAVVEFAHNFPRQELLDAIGLGLVDEDRNRQHLDICRKARTVAGGVISAAGEQARQQNGVHGESENSNHCTFPCGRTAARALAQSTAVMAARRRLSTAAQSQKPFSCDESWRRATRISSLPATFTLLGESSCDRATCKCSPARAWEKSPADTFFSNST